MNNPGRFHLPAAWLAGIAVSATLLTGCAKPYEAKRVEQAGSFEQRKPGAKSISLFETPKNMREDIRYPEATQMGFYWTKSRGEWRFKLPSSSYGHAGFRFLIPHNLNEARDRYELVFTLRPAMMARYLWVGLVDGEDHPERVLVDLPLSSYAPGAKGRDEIMVRIPIRDFPASGPVISAAGQLVEDTREIPFDWFDVLEIRFIHNGGRLPAHETVVTDLHFKR